VTAVLRTERLVLRSWRASDREPFAALNADPRVMEWFPELLTRARSDEVADRIERAIAENGWGLWAVEVPAVAGFIGFVGLNPDETTLGRRVVEVGWRLDAAHWGKGYATEAARAALAYGFDELGLEAIVAFTAVGNTRSRRVMERLGMTRDPHDDFEHPRVPVGSPVRAHVMYRARR
jgi:RimJ/RimL family protein N-acetyltransferase